ncbi:MAG: restriction endonuclease subunit M [Treponema sp.]|uniref:restriction endonuclease subunit M n=1 Tax=Treponema sp. TaxID=166 RepID=UPI0025D8304A|nr:restriction endonuclease subunit M [Treponema sp.]MBQ9283303.1 restriction endonuclease subunit M [Treponema sp.]
MSKSQTHCRVTFPFSDEVLTVLLLDHSTGKNILWATDDYSPISSKSQIEIAQITGLHSDRIKPRIQKQKEEQAARTRNKAEVFTPSWICNAQNNLIDEAWIGRKNVFNSESKSAASSKANVKNADGKKWTSIKEKIFFSTDIQSGKTWQDYIKLTRLEISCGEAPYLVSRYDSVSGKQIKIKDRIGLLDRKLRVVCENVQNEAEYLLWTKIAFQNCYGFELQGDNLLIARSNMLLSYNEYTKHFLKRDSTEEEQMEIAEIVSWNLWQMDGLTSCTPFSSPEEEEFLYFEEFDKPEHFPCKIMDWKENKIILYKSLLKKRGA